MGALHGRTSHQGDRRLTTLQVLNVENGDVRKLTNHENSKAMRSFPRRSRVAYWYPRDGDPNNEMKSL